jgi:magnesium-transporting ATPase (P-type)
MQLCIWLSFLLAGFSSNVIDRYRIGGVIDFIKIPSQPVFVNVADLIQLLSFVFFLWSLKNVGVIRQNESRLFQLVYPKSQIRFALKYALTSLFSSLAISSFFFIFIRSLSGGPEISAQIFVSQTIFISLVFSIIFFLIGLIASIRWFGPIFAFSRFIDQIDEVKDFKLRQTDELKELEEISKKIIKKIGH